MKKKSKKKLGKPTCRRVVAKMGQCDDCKKETRKRLAHLEK